MNKINKAEEISENQAEIVKKMTTNVSNKWQIDNSK